MIRCSVKDSPEISILLKDKTKKNAIRLAVKWCGIGLQMVEISSNVSAECKKK